jgi:tripartite-type tricarboxylate transporter receptor subunit TctC
VLQRLNAEINKALALPDLRARLIASDNVPTGGSAADFARQIATESEHNARIISNTSQNARCTADMGR